jgi:nitrate/nitrite transporter NarK
MLNLIAYLFVKGAMLWGNAIYSVGAILIAAATTVRSYKFMIFGVVVQALGDIATQVAQYKVFSSWFAPSNGFASTLGFELGIGKIGSFVGKATANIIAKKTGDFSWVYWTAVFMNLFTNVITIVFWFFTRWCQKLYSGMQDPATGEKLTEKSKKFEIGKTLRLPWTFWIIIGFSLFQTSTAVVYSQNATEMAEQRFNISAIKAGWYSAMSQYLGFFLVPLIGVFVDLLGNRVTLMLVCGLGMLLSMCLAAWGPSIGGTAASFGIYAVASSFGPTVIIDSIRTSMRYQEVFGSGYAIKIAVNNSMNIIIRIVTGVIQDRDHNSYDTVVVIYVVLAAGSVVVACALFACSFWHVDAMILQWTKKQRSRKGDIINERREASETGTYGLRNRKLGLILFIAMLFLVAGAWAAYFWGVATGNNS